GRWGKYNALDTKELLEAADRFLMDGDEARFSLVALDSETNGLDLYKSVVIGFSFAVSATQGFYVPMLCWSPDLTSLKAKKIKGVVHNVYERGCLKCWWTGKTYPEFVTPKEYQPPEFIKQYLKRWFTKVMLLAHNAPFDINQVWANFGIDLSENLFLDTALLAHIVNENTPNALKEVATEFKEELGFDPWVDANAEQKELGASIIQNGGTYNARTKHVWRAGKEPLDKYGCADTFLTYGIFEVLMQKFLEEYGEEKLPWLLSEEVMPVCREVVIPMKRRGVYIDVPYFKELREQTARVMLELEDRFLAEIPAGHLGKFSKGKSIEEEVSQGRLIKKIIELEGLKIPTKLDKKTGAYKETMAKGEIKKAYQQDPHWVWGYILGEDELRYSDERLAKLRAQLYYESTGRRYRFNLGSDAHLRWLFCDRLGMDPKSLPQTDSATKDNPIPSMAAEVLEERMLPLFPWVRSLMLYKKLSKLQGTYIEPAIELNQDGWLFMDMKQNGTISGRFSCSGGFNLQTLPKVEELDKCGKCGAKEITVKHLMPLLATITCAKCHHVEKDILCPSAIKRGFIAPPGYKIVNADYSSLEPRVFAFMSSDSKLKQVYWDNLDLYSKVYCDMMGEDYVDLKKAGRKAERDLIKPVILSIPYGSRDPQVAVLMGLKKRVKFLNKKSGRVESKEVLDVEKGKYYRDLYLSTYGDLAKYMERQELACITEGKTRTLVGRIRHFEHAPRIYKQLVKAGISIEDFLDARYSDLTKATIKVGDGILKRKQFEKLCKRFGFKVEDAIESGAWAYLRELFKKDYNGAKNTPIQGLAGHICNMGMLDTNRGYRAAGIDGWVALQIHDEILSYVRADQAEAAVPLMKRGMEENMYAKLIDIPMIADPLVADNMRDAK
ncbi:MAG: hypothetical protein C5B47_08120, partial [Verrucomicrobia bacterium]